MESNTKLTAEAKAAYKQMRTGFYADGGTFGEAYPFIVAKLPQFKDANMSYFGLAICSSKEKKFRRSVGRNYAMRRLYHFASFVLPTMISAQNLAEYLQSQVEGDLFTF